jgi:hypothetical protein
MQSSKALLVIHTRILDIISRKSLTGSYGCNV